MQRRARPWITMILFITLTVYVSGTGTQGLIALAAPLISDQASAVESAAVPRFEAASCAWKLPAGQIEGQTVTCGFAVVPEQHRNPTGPTIKLPVAVFKSANPHPAPDPIIYLQGGPGGAVEDFITGFLDDNLSTYTANRDLIIFDQRGVGFAQPTLACPEVTAADLADAVVQTNPNDKTSHDIAAIFTCRDRLMQQGIDLTAYTSAESAADVNDIRAVLGYAKLDLLGISYGTRLGLTIMRDFPDAVRSAVLDSTVPLQAPLIEDNGPNFARSFNLFFASCVADRSCGTKYPTLQADYRTVVTQLTTHPLTVSATDMKTNKTYPVVVDGNSFTFLLSEMLYDATATRFIPPLIQQVSKGETSVLSIIVNALGPAGPDINVGAYFSIMCAEELPFNNRDRATAAADGLSPDLREIFLADIREHFEVCAGWPTPPVNTVETQPVTSDVPALVLSSDNDPATPPDYGQQTAQTLSKGFLITFPGIGHSILGNGGSCGEQTIFSFIDDPTTKPATECIGKQGS